MYKKTKNNYNEQTKLNRLTIILRINSKFIKVLVVKKRFNASSHRLFILFMVHKNDDVNFKVFTFFNLMTNKNN